MELKHIIEAITTLEKAADMLCNYQVTPEARGTLSAKCWMAAVELKVGIRGIQVEVKE